MRLEVRQAPIPLTSRSPLIGSASQPSIRARRCSFTRRKRSVTYWQAIWTFGLSGSKPVRYRVKTSSRMGLAFRAPFEIMQVT